MIIIINDVFCIESGTFSLSTPLVLLGYEYDTKGYLFGSDTTSKDISKYTYLSLFLTIDPCLQLPEPLVLKVSKIKTKLKIYVTIESAIQLKANLW